jgi:ABC-type transporter Mla maintaining outer membrane lipid asymmetry permease subunit MlaE
LFIAASLFSGYLFGILFGAKTGGARGFLDSVAGSLQPMDVVNVIAKSLIPGALSGVICCVEGLAVGTTITDVPQAIARSVQQSVVVLFLTSAVISVLTYL